MKIMRFFLAVTVVVAVLALSPSAAAQEPVWYARMVVLVDGQPTQQLIYRARVFASQAECLAFIRPVQDGGSEEFHMSLLVLLADPAYNNQRIRLAPPSCAQSTQ